MKKCIGVLIGLVLSQGVLASDFSPTLLKLRSEPCVRYNFDGYPLDIPVTVEGTSAGIIFSIYTKDWHEGIRDIRNGYLGWHYVNRVDTCVYFSSIKSVLPGTTLITWDGCDQDGEPLPSADYTYYLWAFDNQGDKQLVADSVFAGERWDYTTSIQSIDESGLPLAHPIVYTATSRWILGNDPNDETLLIPTTITLENGWQYRGEPLLQPDDFNYQYLSVSDGRQGSILKFKFVPFGIAEIQSDWGEDAPFAAMHASNSGASAGIATDGTYLFTTEADTHGVSGQSDFYIYDFDGYLVDSIDLSPWWTVTDDEHISGTVSAGPLGFETRDKTIFLFSHISCLRMMIDPQRYLEEKHAESENLEPLVLWENGNGDYTLDKNFEETSLTPWLCNDGTTGVFSYGAGIDVNQFVINSAEGAGAVSFGLLGPDGTGMGYYSFAGERSGFKTGQKVVDSDTVYDGIYCDNASLLGECWGDQCNTIMVDNLYYIAHDSIKGKIETSGECFGLPGVFTIVSPGRDTQLVAGNTMDITWSFEGSNCSWGSTVTLEYSSDNGENWERIATGVAISDFSYAWDVPRIETDECLVRIMDGKYYKILDITDEPFSIVSDVAVAEPAPATFSLSQNIPNPFNPVTTIPFSLGKDSAVRLAVYNTAGEKVATLAEGAFRAGEHSVTWDASGFASGVYFVRMEAGEFVESRKMMLVK